MENKINIADLLRNCPQGMELDCTVCNDVVTLVGVDKEGRYPIRVVSKSGFYHLLTCEGYVYAEEDAKCVIFPKGKTTWEGFHRPFIDGDVVATQTGNWIGIVKNIIADDYFNVHCVVFLTLPGKFYTRGEFCFSRLATDEEKQELFYAIKANGYKWNAKTKTLEKLNEPRFKVGDRIKSIYGYYQYDIKGLTNIHYTLVEVEKKFKSGVNNSKKLL